MLSLITKRDLGRIGLIFVSALSVTLGTAAAASAADLPAGGATSAEVGALFRDLGDPVETATDKAGNPLIHTAMGGSKVDIYFYNCTTTAGTARCNSIQFAAGFVISAVSLSTINAWNRDKRYGRAYLSSDGYPFMEVDVDISAGATTAQIRAYARHVETLLPDFRTAIGYKG